LNNTGDTDISVSLWLKREADTTGTVWMIGNPTQTNGQNLAFDIYASGGSLYLWTPSGPQLLDTDGALQFPVGQWVHLVCTRTGPTLKVYIDGVDWTPNMTYSTAAFGLALPANSKFRLGLRMAANVPFTGKISNSKVYNVVLEPSEVRKLYNLGRTGRSMVISDTAVGIGKVPEAQLDVRGNINSTGIMTNKNYMFFATGPPSAMLQAGVAGGNDLVANFSRIEFILGSGFDTSTKTYTIPCSGYWEFSYCLLARNVAAGVHWVMGRWLINGVLYDNRSFVYFTGQGGGSQESNLIGKIIGYYTAGTTISVRISQNSVGTDVYMSSNYSHFFGKLLH
jgi:hypothetical protein